MMLSYIKVALRNLVKHGLNSWINVFGLAIGLASCLLILMYIVSELGYDGFHQRKDRIYRVVVSVNQPDGFRGTWAVTGTAPGPFLEEEYPEVERAVRFFRPRVSVRRDNSVYYEDRFFFVDPGVFDVFSFGLSEGDPETALREPYSLVLTQDMARKYFGDVDPIGLNLTIYGGINVTVTGVLDEVPQNSHLKFDFLTSFETFLRESPSFRTRWDSAVWTYLLLRDGASAAALEPRLREFTAKYRDGETASWTTYHLQPLADIHSSPLHFGGEPEPTVDVANLHVFGAVGLLILLIGCVNFVNLSTVQYTDRWKEAGIRKALGARRSQLVRQYLCETTVLVIISVFLAMVLAELFMPTFNDLAETNLGKRDLGGFHTIVGMIGVVILVGVIAGGYPALAFSSLSPVALMRGRARTGRTSAWMRRLLVAFQFAVSTVLIICATVIYSQFDFLRSKDLGFETRQIIVVPIPRTPPANSYQVLKRELERSPAISGVAASSDVPGGTDCRGLSVRPEGSNRDMVISSFFVDIEYPEILGLEFLEGRGFDREIQTDAGNAIIINETAITVFGWETGEGRRLTVFTGRPGDLSESYEATVIGVVKDHHFRYLDYPIRPFAMRMTSQLPDYLLIRTGSEDMTSALDHLRAVWSQVMPGEPIEFFFLDDYIEGLYGREQRYFTMFGYACLLALAVACFGLFGLASFVMQQRTKEIGIRKVLGASVSGIAIMLSKEFAILAAVSNLIAWPVAFYFMMGWLQAYRYRIGLSIWYFVLAGALTILLVLITVGHRSIRSAAVNPVESLRYE